MRWNSPPNWPTPPPGWTPPQGWQPDPSWGPPPPGHTFWVPDQPAYQPNQPTAQFPASHYPGPPPPDGQGGGSNSKVWIVVGLVTLLVLALGGALALTVFNDEDDSPTSSRTDEPTEDPTDEPTAEPPDEPTETPVAPSSETPETGTPETDVPAGDTLPLGQSAPVGDWEVSVDAVEKDANKLIADTNEFNERPSGQYVLADLTATYQGAGKADAWLEVQPKFVEEDGTEHPYYECSAVVPEPGFETPSLAKGKSASYQVCFDVPVEGIDGGEIVIVDLADYAGEGVAWSVD